MGVSKKKEDKYKKAFADLICAYPDKLSFRSTAAKYSISNKTLSKRWEMWIKNNGKVPVMSDLKKPNFSTGVKSAGPPTYLSKISKQIFDIIVTSLDCVGFPLSVITCGKIMYLLRCLQMQKVPNNLPASLLEYFTNINSNDQNKSEVNVSEKASNNANDIDEVNNGADYLKLNCIGACEGITMPSKRTVERLRAELKIKGYTARLTTNKADACRTTKNTEKYINPHLQLIKTSYECFHLKPQNIWFFDEVGVAIANHKIKF